MAKSSKFNFSNTPSANEIGEEMSSVNTSYQTSKVVLPSRERSVRTKNSEWTLTQCRLPNDLHMRMKKVCLEKDITLNDFLVESVKCLLNNIYQG